MPGMSKYYYKCPICKTPQWFISASEVPICKGPENTHSKEMKFLPDMSTGTPPYLTKKH